MRKAVCKFRMYTFKHIFEWKIPNQDDYHNVVDLLYTKYNHLHSSVIEQFGSNGWVVLGLFAFFLLLIVVIYIKSIIDTFRVGKAEIKNEDTLQDGLFYTIEEAPQIIANDNEDEEETEKTNKETDTPKVLRSTADELEKELSLNLLKASQEHITEDEQQKISSDIRKKIKVHSDMENAKIRELRTYLESKQEDKIIKNGNNNIISTIINLLGRGVTIAKINQSLYYHYKKVFDIHDIIHTVQSVCNFIGICNAGKFDYLPQRQLLPENDAAVYAWANGDSSLALILLQSFLNQLMEQSKEENGIIKEMTYALASNCACIMGDIAKLNDLDLAHNSFELATELSPQNVTAWNRLGDIYMLDGAEQKAMIAYQNVIDIADAYLYAAEVAHAKQQLAEYYRKQELINKSEQFKQESEAYYDDAGICRDLTEKEILAYNTISAGSEQNLRQYIYNLLNGYIF